MSTFQGLITDSLIPSHTYSLALKCLLFNFSPLIHRRTLHQPTLFSLLVTGCRNNHKLVAPLARRRPFAMSNQSHPSASASHFRLDPLLRSTFGHRSIDLYGSQIDQSRSGTGNNDVDQDDNEDDDDNQTPDDSHLQSNRRGHFGNSSLINASRYGPARSAALTAAGSEIPEIADEDDDRDADDVSHRDEDFRDQRDHDIDRQWGRGVNVSHLSSAARSSSSPSSSILSHASSHTSSYHPPNFITARPVSDDRIDPFLVEDDESDAPPAQDAHHPSRISKGKARARDDQRPKPTTQPTSPPTARSPSMGSAARGWLAYSFSKSTHHTKNAKYRPKRDVYSIYDDDNEEFDSEEDDGREYQDDSGDDLLSESDADDQQASSSNRMNQSTSIHHPTKMSASTLPRQAQDNFHRKLFTTTKPTPEAAESGIIDTYSYPTSIGTSIASWKPWASGNNPRWREWKDHGALVLWTLATLFTFALAGGASLGITSPSPPKSPATRPSPYYTITRSLPLLLLLCGLSLAMAVFNLAFLRNLERMGGGRYLRFTLISTPTLLSLGWLWAFAGSFFYEDEKWSGGWWSTSGLRLTSLFPLLLAIIFSRALYLQQRQLGRSLSVLSLSAKILSAHPTLLLLSLIQILVFLVVSVPFMTIFVRLFLLGHFSTSPTTGQEWITDSRARTLAWLTLGTWIWTWAALRGVMRVVVSSTVSHWYFHGPPSKEEDEEAANPPLFTASAATPRRNQEQPSTSVLDDEEDSVAGNGEESSIIGLGASESGHAPGAWASESTGRKDNTADELEHRNPTAKDIVRASFLRATGPSFGTILMSALLLAVSRLLILFSILARNLARALSSPTVPTFLHPLAHLAYLVSGTGSVIKGLSDYTLIYAGITGQGFWKSSRRCGRILARGGAKGVMDGLLISTILSLLTVSLSFLAALAGFLFSAHQLHVPADAPLVGLLCGVVPYWTLRLGADVLANGADTLYLCYAIDSSATTQAEGGQEERSEARRAFEGASGGARAASGRGEGGGGFSLL